MLAEVVVEPEVFHQTIVMEQVLLVEQGELVVMVEVPNQLQVCKEQPTVVVAEAVENKMKPLVQVVQV
jgi:hypothetical protein